jgi:hypothetical protein
VSTCAEVKSCAPDSLDGEYLIFPEAFDGESAKIYCHNMSGIPEEYVTIHFETYAAANWSNSAELDGCDLTRLVSRDKDIVSTFHKIRVLPEVNVCVLVSETTLIFATITS